MPAGAAANARSKVGLWLRYLFFLRFPVMLGIALVGLPFLALGPAESLLGNLFVLGPWGVLLVSWLAFSVSFVVLLTARLTVRGAPARFGLPPLPLLPAPAGLSRFGVPLAALLAVPLAAALVLRSPGSPALLTAAAAGGLGLALLGLVIAAAAQKAAADPGGPAPDLVLSTDRGLLGRIPTRAGHRRSAEGGPEASVAEAPDGVEGAATVAGPGAGYRHPETGGLIPGHLLAAAFFGLTLVVYLTGYFAFRPGSGWPGAGGTGAAAFPSLGHVLLIFLLAGWALPGVSFALDRFRVPVLLVLLAISFLANLGSDHYYPVVAESSGFLLEGRSRGLSPMEAFTAADRRQGSDRPVVLVAASGGGITASLWTATVLTGLQGEVGEEVTRSLRLLSSVSGGSVGALYFLDRFGPSGAPPPGALEGIREMAGASSLDGVSWGLAYPDLWRIFFSLLVRDPFLDRGWALERIWRGRLRHPEATLGDWYAKMKDGRLPAAVFNSTVVETGDQLLLTPLTGAFAPQAVNFLQTYPDHDLAVSTAARLSASFPWISPVSRPRVRAPDGEAGAELTPAWHGADGGYYDNYGIVTVVSWILYLKEPQLEQLRRRGVVLVRIRAFPQQEDGEAAAEPADRGWIYSALGPVITLLNVRTATQSFRDDVDVRLLSRLAREKDIPVTLATFTLEAPSPLSWKLTGPERRTIVDGWRTEANRQELCKVKEAFGREC